MKYHFDGDFITQKSKIAKNAYIKKVTKLFVKIIFFFLH